MVTVPAGCCYWLGRFACMKVAVDAQVALVWTAFSEAHFANNTPYFSKIQPLTDLEMKC